MIETTGPLYIGIDPSISATGIALIEDLPSRPRLVVGQVLVPPAGTDPQRFAWLMEKSHEVLRGLLDKYPSIVKAAVELPQTSGWGRGARNSTTLPTYGVAVGICLTIAVSVFTADRVWGVSATTWGRGIPRGDGQEAKLNRVAAWQMISGKPILEATDIRRAAVADAALIALWAGNKLALEARYMKG